MRKDIASLLIVGFALVLAACGKSETRAAPQTLAVPQPRERLAIQLIADEVMAAEPASAPTPSAQPAPPPTGDPTVDPAGFRLTVPVCQRAERQDDPLAKTPECVQLLQAARDQAEACRKGFENGDDRVALSAACRQAAGFR